MVLGRAIVGQVGFYPTSTPPQQDISCGGLRAHVVLIAKVILLSVTENTSNDILMFFKIKQKDFFRQKDRKT